MKCHKNALEYPKFSYKPLALVKIKNINAFYDIKKYILFFIVVSCNTISLKENETFPKTILSQTQHLGDLALTCTLKPTATPAPMRSAPSNAYPPPKFYVTLSFAVQGKALEGAFGAYPNGREQVITYLGSRLHEDMFLETTADTIRATACLYPRQYNPNRPSVVLVAFDADSSALARDVTVVYRAQRFGLGTVRFPFSAAAVRAAALAASSSNKSPL